MIYMIEVTQPNPYQKDKFVVHADNIAEAFAKFSEHCKHLNFKFANETYLAYGFYREADVVNVYHEKATFVKQPQKRPKSASKKD